jgi:hypothetical protein
MKRCFASGKGRTQQISAEVAQEEVEQQIPQPFRKVTCKGSLTN